MFSSLHICLIENTSKICQGLDALALTLSENLAYKINVRYCKRILYQRTQPLLCSLQAISAHVRELLGIRETLWSRSIADPPRDSVGLFLEQKSRTGERADDLTYQRFLDG